MREIVVIFFLVLGTVFIFLGAIGLLKMPDVFLRMSASTIAATLGVSSILIALAIHFAEFGITVHVIGTNIFLFLTVPVGAHLMGRAAHKSKYKKWDKTVLDRLEGKYKKGSRSPESGLEEENGGSTIAENENSTKNDLL
ncbi:MAG: monovalent cation/H(+) antiporter subunit G [Bacteroidales bacterium]|nr:monovalent cation/H(+) antiporter subunit G [Bacteroidales bacterium]